MRAAEGPAVQVAVVAVAVPPAALEETARKSEKLGTSFFSMFVREECLRFPEKHGGEKGEMIEEVTSKGGLFTHYKVYSSGGCDGVFHLIRKKERKREGGIEERGGG